MDTVTIDPRFCGPPDIGNGGYVAGLIGRRIDGPARVTLRAPAPLARPLGIREDSSGIDLLDGDRTLARAEPHEFRLETPPAVDRREVEQRLGSCRAFDTHPFPRCFVCGPEREVGDGLRILPGPVPGTDRVAASWTPTADLADARGNVREEFVWAALDSPSSFPLLEDPEARRLEPMVLGRLAVRLDAPVRAGAPHLVIAWPLGLEGRRGDAGIALYDPGDRVVARGRATWVSIAGS